MNMPWPPSRAPQALTRDFLAIAEGIGGEVGHAFLERLVLALRNCMDVDLVLLTTGDDAGSGSVHATYALDRGDRADDIVYELDGTPCALVYAGEPLVVPCGLETAFPRETGYQGYVGVPIRRADGGICGALSVFSTAPIAEPDAATAILQIFAYRVEAERQHEALARRREALIAKLSLRNARLKALSRRLRKANEFKTRLTGLIAHDLRSPLAAIVSQTELIEAHAARHAELSGKIRKGCAKVIEIAERMNTMIGATLARVREDSVEIEPVIAPCDLASIAHLAVDANAGESERKSIAISVDAASPVLARADEDLILEAVDNLVSNAVKYTHPGGRITLAAGRRHDVAFLRVSDTGQGMTEFDLERVFGRFETLSAKPTGGEAALGLGLSNVRDIVEAHGGRVTAASPGRGRGATFEIVLAAA